jgi:hypothetical protein
MIHHRLGDWELARDYLRRALATNPSFQLLQAALAERTLNAIEGALAMGIIQEATDER